ncbi:hypothetical protein P13BB106kb_p033 [Pectobacterium phage DU_PP_V]|uniref:I-spanin n=1 Tax=Pectobacterium phage DU_PP_V TaxID=2041492 RepID=A0A2D2W6U1_9CAUD|nr:Rz-like spanin [Pectobacterium phage DU_PP_V]ATS94017.1 hypothetical protein P13BB106kb_p033 [Pectobacterium phage DU_PP_V]
MFTTALKSVFSSPWVYVLLLVLCVLSLGYLGVNKISSLSEDVQGFKSQVSLLEEKNEALSKKMVSMGWYHTTVLTNQNALNNRVSKLTDSLSREDIIAAKPGLVTRIAKKQNADLEERLACASGNRQYCR